MQTQTLAQTLITAPKNFLMACFADCVAIADVPLQLILKLKFSLTSFSLSKYVSMSMPSQLLQLQLSLLEMAVDITQNSFESVPSSFSPTCSLVQIVALNFSVLCMCLIVTITLDLPALPAL